MPDLLEQQGFMDDFIKKSVMMVDSATYAYTKGMIEYLQTIGEDPREYEVVIGHDQNYTEAEDGFKITQRIRVMKRSEVAALPVSGPDDGETE